MQLVVLIVQSIFRSSRLQRIASDNQVARCAVHESR